MEYQPKTFCVIYVFFEQLVSTFAVPRSIFFFEL